jgi:hypothetical protein
MNRIARIASSLALALLGGCYATMARVSPRIEGRLLDHGRPVSGARVYLATDAQAGRCGTVPGDAQASRSGVFTLDEVRQPQWVSPEPRYGSWTLCLAYAGRTYVGYSMSQLDFPPARLRLDCELSEPQQRQAEHPAGIYGLCRRG